MERLNLRTGLLCLFMLAGYTTRLIAQGEPSSTVSLGPFNWYVSQQGGNLPYATNVGTPAMADEGRVVDVKVSSIIGPIDVNPKNFPLTGPVCPTYTPHGQRVPATPAPVATANFSGNITLKEAQIPAAGNTADASFQVKEEGYWTTCSTGEKHYYTTPYIVNFKIISLLIELSDANLNICKGDEKEVTITRQHPASGGSITWASANSKVQITQTANGAKLKGAVGGQDKVTATIEAGGVKYKAEVNVFVNEIEFTKAAHEELWWPGGTYDVSSLLTATSTKAKIDWAIAGAPAAAINANTGVVTFPAAFGGEYTITASAKNLAACKKTIKLTLVGFRVHMLDRIACDGAEARLEILPVPATAALATIKGLAYTLSNATAVRSFGNPAGTTVLAFAALDANLKSKVNNTRWYSTQANHCNVTSGHTINAFAMVKGQRVNATPDNLTATVTIPACLDGWARITRTFNGVPTLNIVQMANGIWDVTITPGTFARAMQGNAWWRAPANSQYAKMVQDEEVFHKGQIEGTTSRIVADLWDPANVWAAVAPPLQYRSPVRQFAINQATRSFWAAVRAENVRSAAAWNVRRCRIEREAKARVGSTHYATMPCTYPACP